MRMRNRTLSILFVCALLLGCSCLTAPTLQSSRIRGKYSLGGSGDITTSKMIPQNLDTITGMSLGSRYIHPFDAISIGKRIELSGLIFSLVLQNSWDAGAKICILDIGNRIHPFRNIGLSIFGSSNGNFSLAGSMLWASATCGIIAGTSMTLGNTEIELCFSPAIQDNWSTESDGESDTTVDIEIRQHGYSFGGGIFLYPWFKKLGLEIGIGGRYIFPYHRSISGEYASHVYLSPYVAQISLRKYWKVY